LRAAEHHEELRTQKQENVPTGRLRTTRHLPGKRADKLHSFTANFLSLYSKKAQEESKAKTQSLFTLASRCTTFEECKELLRTHKGQDAAERATSTYEAVGWIPGLLYLYLF
jgi:hypothetical protein